jgi:small-conductance mechanosensitive channel
MNWEGFWSGVRFAFHAELFAISGTPVSTMTLATFVAVVVLSFWASRLLQRTVSRFLALRGIKDEGTLGVAERLTHYLVLALGLGVALQTLGINLTALFAAGAFVAVAVGFAMQNVTQNLVAGIILLVERTIKPGDILSVEGRMVRVARLGTRGTVARTLDDEDLIIPNSTIVQTTVTNYTLRDKNYRIRIPVGVTYSSDMAIVRSTLERVAREAPWRSSQYDPVVLMVAFGSSSVDWEVSVWIDDPWKEKRFRAQLHESIWWALKEAKVLIAFSQVDVHMDPPVMKALERIAGPRGRA